MKLEPLETVAAEPSARAWLRSLAAGECSSRELVERTLARIEAVQPELNAVVAIEPDRALDEAEAADRRRADGADLPPLLGLPITVKDTLDVAGWATSYGSFASSPEPAATDASAIGRLRAAGAIVVAKTNVPEASSDAETENARFGRTNNPWDPDRTPGGSSGGEAALLGADASIVGVGVDGGCSIRLPSHYCGTVGIRPTAGRVPETGLRPGTRASGSLDMSCVGPMGRRVEDLELLLGLICGADGVDPFAPPIPPPLAAPPELPLRVGHYTIDPLIAPTAATVEAVHAAAAAIGASEEVEPPDLSAATEVVFDAFGADGGAHITRAVAGAEGRHTAQFAALLAHLAGAEPLSAEAAFDRVARLFDLRAAVRAFVAGHDVIVCPVAAGPAPRHGEAPAEAGDGAADSAYDWLNYCSTYSVAGLPVVVVPAGSEAGLPIGVQIVAAPFREDLALLAAARVEAALGGFRPAPIHP
ncbi:MAG: amidase [Actinobacteria bacterium]|nr:amidase [Actinomycetota bacterium]